MDIIKTDYNSVYLQRKSLRYKKIFTPYSSWFKKQLNLYNSNVLDFGCNIESVYYKLCKEQGGIYHGYDVDNSTIKWLKQKDYYIDFWKGNKKYDYINGSQVYEHLNVEERKLFLARCNKLLNEGGTLSLDFPYIENLNITNFFRDLTHYPVSSWDDPLIIQNAGFSFDYVYLVGYPALNPFQLLLNYLLFGNWQTNTQIFARKST